jgi:hypothetical protein
MVLEFAHSANVVHGDWVFSEPSFTGDWKEGAGVQPGLSPGGPF